MISSPVGAHKKKRTRTNVTQSKYGCFTCKARRIKCDELKPSCRRCLTAKRSCGYPRGAPLGPTPPSSSLASSPESCLTLNTSDTQDRFVKLVCNVLAQGPRRAKNDVELAFWSHLVPQLTQSIPAVRVAAASFGASYDAHVLGGSRSPEAIAYYTQALSLLQVELASPRHGAVPCIVACLFLACAEVLEQQLDKGLLHLQGAFSLMRSHSPGAFVDMEGVSLLFQKLDLHSATYAVSLGPDLPPLLSPSPDALLSNSSDESLFRVLHVCYHFTSTACLYKYVSNRLIPPELLIEQGRQLANLKQWLSHHESATLFTSKEQMTVLRAQCLAALVNTANILEPRETAFDSYGPEFEEIISSAETLASCSKSTDLGAPRSGRLPDQLPSFTVEMGIIHPLHFAALKYRHSTWRRRAIDLLRKSGREGPWCGPVEAAVVSAVVKVEERRAAIRMGRPEEDVAHEPGDFAQSDRINACWIAEYLENDAPSDAEQRAGAKRVKVMMVRCRDVDKMLREEVIGPCRDPWQDRTHWEGRPEIVQVA